MHAHSVLKCVSGVPICLKPTAMFESLSIKLMKKRDVVHQNTGRAVLNHCGDKTGQRKYTSKSLQLVSFYEVLMLKSRNNFTLIKTVKLTAKDELRDSSKVRKGK